MSSSTSRPLLDSANATSRSLLAGVRANDADAWERLVHLYTPFVLHSCRAARLSKDDTADVFQEVFKAAFTRIETFEKATAGDTFRGWLRTITRHKAIDHYRRQKREPRAEGGTEIQRRLSEVCVEDAVDDGSSVTGPVSQADQAELRLFHEALEQIRAQFKERTWQAFHGTAIDCRTPTDVGEELGMSPGAVRVAKSRVLQRLRTELGDLG